MMRERYARGRQLGPRYIARIVIALAAMLVWGAFSLNFALGVQQRAVDEQSAPPLPVATKVLNRPNPVPVTYPELLQKARMVCPEDRPFILLNDGDDGVVQLSDYLLYPREILLIHTDNLANAVGGCAANYGIDAERRLALFGARLELIVCAAEGCLYSIR
jgi:hypothetical protein